MTAQARLLWDSAEPSFDGTALRLSETHGGYSFGEPKGGFDTDLLAEAVLKFFGLVMVLSAGAQWLVPSSVIAGDPLVLKSGMMASFGLIGMGLYWHANRGLREEVQVDTSRRELRLVTRNSRGEVRVRRTIAMRDVESAFVRRSKVPASPAQLFLRIRGVTQPLQLLAGREGDLAHLHERLSRDLRSPQARVAARLA